jgi:hypothetical protein
MNINLQSNSTVIEQLIFFACINRGSVEKQKNELIECMK